MLFGDSYPLLPPSVAGSSPSPPAHPVASYQHPQHYVSRNSTLEMNIVDPPVPRKYKMIPFIGENTRTENLQLVRNTDSIASSPRNNTRGKQTWLSKCHRS